MAVGIYRTKNALSRRTMTSVCFLRKATSSPKLAAKAAPVLQSTAVDKTEVRNCFVFMMRGAFFVSCKSSITHNPAKVSELRFRALPVSANLSL